MIPCALKLQEMLIAELPQPKICNYNLRSERVLERYYVRTQRFDNTFFPYCIQEWNELHVSIRTGTTFSQFKNELIKCIRPPKRSTFKIDDILKSVPLALAEFRHNRIVQSPHENYFDICREHKEK